MAMKGHQASDHFRKLQRDADLASQWFEQVRKESAAARQRIVEARTAAARALGEAYLPDLRPETIARTERLTGFRGFSRRDPQKAMDHERQVLEQTIRQVEADPRFVDREGLIGRHGTLIRQRDEALEMRAPWDQECAKYETLEGFLDLVQLGYDTPDFAEKWWQPSYWKHWAAGDRICEALGLKDFGDDVLPAYKQVAEQRQFWEQKVRDAQAAMDVVRGLVQSRDRAQARIPQLPALYLAEAQDVLGDFLTGAELGLLDQWLDAEPEDDRAVRMGLRRLAGIQAKLALLGELEDRGLDAQIGALRSRAKKYGRKAAKYTRPKHSGRTVGDRDLDLGFRAKLPKMEQQRDKLGALIGRIERYDDYGRFSLENEPNLWWHAMSGGKAPPRLMPNLRRWHDKNPGRAPILDAGIEDSDTAPQAPAGAHASSLAVAMVANRLGREDEEEDGGYLS
jgi:hypothetical protein